MEKPEFDNKFTEADNILKGLKYKVDISSFKTMSLDQDISVLKVVSNQVSSQTNELAPDISATAHDISATENAINRLKTDVLKVEDEISAFDMSLKEESAPAPGQLMDEVKTVMIDVESIKVEMSIEEGEEIVDQLKNEIVDQLKNEIVDQLKNVEEQQKENSK